ncbi:hypothetical protein [Georgenia sp. SUBG003]|uniref:hypothetical protein n=1 Tax=Georgenia sp. SUBG003 TaxID=1497974 RepID=UPI003AB4CCF4
MTYVLFAASPTPAPEPTEMEPWEVSPGLMGFLLGFFVLAVAVVPLFRSMAKHMRRVDHNERLRRAAEEASRDGAPSGGGTPGGAAARTARRSAAPGTGEARRPGCAGSRRRSGGRVR